MPRALLATWVAGLLLAVPTASAVEAPFAPNGAWCWFQDPRAVYADGRTYAGYVTSGGDVAVSAYDHRRNELRRAIIAHRFQRDDHVAPALHVLPDGRLMAIFSAHRGQNMYLRTTRRPHDVTSWDDTRALGTNAPGFETYTYANPVSAGGRLFLFWRAEAGGNGSGQTAYTVSNDHGTSWARGRLLMRNPKQRPYAKYAGAGDKIHVAYTDGHPQSTRTGIRYAAFRNRRLYRANGAAIGRAPMRSTAGESVYRGRRRAWVWDVASDSKGHPVIVYAIFRSKTDHRYRYARWTGTRWIHANLARAGGSIATASREYLYSGGIALDHGDPSTVYMSRRIDGVFEIERWRTPDRGRHWSRSAVTRGSTRNQVRPVVPRGAPAGASASVLWMSGAYPDYMNYRTSLRARFAVAPTDAPPPPIDPQTPPPGGGQGGGSGDPPPEGARVPGLKLKVSRAIVQRGQRVRITVTMWDTKTRKRIDGRTVKVLQRVAGSRRWRQIVKTRTSRRGTITLTRAIRRRTDFRAVYGGSPLMTKASSPTARVYVERRPSRMRSAAD